MIRPSYWTDADLHIRLTSAVREFYIGLWMMADDAGYVAWDVTRVGAELYPFRAQAWRTRELPKMLARLGPGHARVLDCGRHVLVPGVPKFNSVPKPSYQNQRAHDTCLRHMAPAGATGPHVAPGGTSTVREEKRREENTNPAPARARERADANGDAASEFQRLVPRPGGHA